MNNNHMGKIKAKKVSQFIEKFTYIDVRHRRNFEFMRDSSKIGELMLKYDEENQVICSNDELKELPVFSNIAAGEPILINPEQADSFYIPNIWIKGMKDCFMLKVKGDSMIGADIDDGDFVVIRKQSTASNKDIVAVDLEGSATLKRLHIEKDNILLMPENEKYLPIPIKDRDASIIGIVVGVVKNTA